ncbi:MAG: hypothetical protein OXN27_05575 [Candidatus Poribacteria bacterium]|nr:hypothetical protein [Candidatus Poribacteria bacterium]
MLIGSNNFNDLKAIFAASQIEGVPPISAGCCDASCASTIPYVKNDHPPILYTR